MSKISFADPAVQYWGSWDLTEYPKANTQYSTCLVPFVGDRLRCTFQAAPGRGQAVIYLDDVFQETLNCAGEEREIIFAKTGLREGPVHYLRVEAGKGEKITSGCCLLEIKEIDVPQTVNVPEKMRQEMEGELEEIQNLKKKTLPFAQWQPVKYQAQAPRGNVHLETGLMRELFRHNIDIVKYDYGIPDFCEGPDTGDGGRGWSHWLPASNHARLLAGAGLALRWEQDPQLREIVDTLVAQIKENMRPDGYYNYYPEADSYGLHGVLKNTKTPPQWRVLQHTERKNYDRVFWTRGMIAAAEAGNPDALRLARRMYDWLYGHEEYMGRLLQGGNSTNGLPGGPLLYHTPVGIPEDIDLNQRFYDQQYWFREIRGENPMAFSHYPGDRPHCYQLLQLEALADLYRATGAQTYLDTLLAGWKLYAQGHKHAGGTSAICEGEIVYPVRSRFILKGNTGETCGSVFWIWVNQKLLQLFPEEEKYASEIEESLFNVILACRTDKGMTRYLNRMQGPLDHPTNSNTCCEVSSTMLISDIPGYIYLEAPDCLYISQYIASAYTGKDLKVRLETAFPENGKITVRICQDTEGPVTLKLRIPRWAESDIAVHVNGHCVGKGTPGSWFALRQKWSAGDQATLELPLSLRTEKYTGFEQEPSGLDRYAIFCGPILMAVTGDFDPKETTPHLKASPGNLAQILIPGEKPLTFHVAGQENLTVEPYYGLSRDGFACYPVFED